MTGEDSERRAAVQRLRDLRTLMADVAESEVDEALAAEETPQQIAVDTASLIILTREFTPVAELSSEESSRHESVSTRIA